jgi:uncharacterized phage-associated protein
LRFVFDERKAAEAAAHLLTAGGGSMPYIKLVKLLYLADRHTLIETGIPITRDWMVSMPKGPVLSRVLELINHGPREEDRRNEYSPWFEYVSAPRGYDVEAVKSPPAEGALSDYEISVLHEVHEKYGRMGKWALVDLTHTLQEWTDPGGSSYPIRPEDILRASGKSDEEIKHLTGEAESAWFMAADDEGWVRVS